MILFSVKNLRMRNLKLSLLVGLVCVMFFVIPVFLCEKTNAERIGYHISANTYGDMSCVGDWNNNEYKCTMKVAASDRINIYWIDGWHSKVDLKVRVSSSFLPSTSSTITDTLGYWDPDNSPNVLHDRKDSIHSFVVSEDRVRREGARTSDAYNIYYSLNVCMSYDVYWSHGDDIHEMKSACDEIIVSDRISSTFEGDSGVVEILNEESDASTRWDEAPSDFVGWTGSGNRSKTYVKNDCDPIDGCWMSFRHYLRRNSGARSTMYKINGDTGRDGLWKNVASTNFDGGKVVNVPSNPVHMYPGQKFCETMTFYSDGVSEMASTTICVVATGAAGSDIDLQIEGQNGRRYVYTKPGDEVRLDGIYDPWYQSMYNTALSSGSTINGGVVGGNTTVGGAFNSITNPGWNNAFSIRLDSDCGSTISGVVGSADRLTGRRVVAVSGDDVGTKKDAIAITNCKASTMTTPNWVSLSNNNGKVAATVNTEPKSSAKVEIYTPYNFVNTADMAHADPASTPALYAGENAKLAYKITVNPKSNRLVTGSDTEKYATVVKNGKVRFVICNDRPNGDDCYFDNDGGRVSGQSWNSDSNVDGATITEIKSIPIPDRPAGSQICIAPSVYPATSGGDGNLDENGDGLWTVPKNENFQCVVIAKSPSFQVWGGNVAANEIKAQISKKYEIANYDGDVPRMFGSWGELAVSTLSGKNQTMASGAAWGYDSNNDGNLQPNPYNGDNIGNPGGGTSNIKCNYSRLTFGSGCGLMGNISGGSGEMEGAISAVVGQIEKKLEVADGRSHHVDGVEEINLGDEEFVKGTRYFKNSGNIYIGKDIKIKRGNNISNLEDAPQVVVYAKGGNINIDCGVKEIDAILIADGVIDTCYYDGKPLGDKDAEKELAKLVVAQTQLQINGAMYANTIKFNRTYGAGTGTRSIVPAEIVNYDNSMLFTGGGGGTPTGGSMDVVYVRELAPRYKDN